MDLSVSFHNKETKTIEVPRGLGDIIATALRQGAMMETPSWRPIGFVLEDGGNMVHSMDYILQDMVSVSSVLATSYFECQSKAEFLIVKTEFMHECKLSDICKDGIQLVSKDKVLVSSLKNTAVPITVIFRNSKGNFTINDNKKFIESKINSSKDFVVLSSRHTPVVSFATEVITKGEKDLINIDFETVNNDTTIIQRTVKMLVNTLSSIA